MTTADLALPSSRSPAAMRRALTMIGGIIATALVAGGALSLLNLAARHTFDVRASYGSVRSLVIDDGGGDVRLTSAPAGAAVSVTEHVTEDLGAPNRQAIRAPGGALRLTATCPGLLAQACDVRYDVAVPAGVPVVASSGAGNVSASGLTTTAAVRLSSGAGEVTASGISAPRVHLDSGAGDVTARLTRPAQQLLASSGAGDVHLTVPDATYAIDASSGAGTVSDQSLRVDPASPRKINASSGAGDVTIRVSR